MEIVIKKEELLNAIQRTQGAVSVKGTLPILSNILIDASKETASLTATDLDIAVSVRMEGEVKEVGAITVPAKRFGDIVRELRADEPVKIRLKKGMTVEIESGKSFFKLIGLSRDDYPQLPGFDNKEKVSVSQTLLSQMIRLTSFAISRDDARYVLNGILFSFQEKKLRMVATDGRRLAMVDRNLDQTTPQIKNVIVPVKAIQELNRNLSEDGDVEICFKDNQIQFKLNNTIIVSRLIDGEFPNYEQVIPKKTKEQVTLKTTDFLQATKRANIFTHQDSQSIRLQLSKNKMIITKNTPDIGELREEVEAEYKGSDFTIGFNPSYLIDVLKNINEDNVQFELIDPEKPGMIKIRDNYTYIILPMQLS